MTDETPTLSTVPHDRCWSYLHTSGVPAIRCTVTPDYHAGPHQYPGHPGRALAPSGPKVVALGAHGPRGRAVLDAMTHDRRAWAEQRATDGQCAMTDGWCTTHDVADDAGHWYARQPAGADTGD